MQLRLVAAERPAPRAPFPNRALYGCEPAVWGEVAKSSQQQWDGWRREREGRGGGAGAAKTGRGRGAAAEASAVDSVVCGKSCRQATTAATKTKASGWLQPHQQQRTGWAAAQTLSRDRSGVSVGGQRGSRLVAGGQLRCTCLLRRLVRCTLGPFINTAVL